MDHSESFYSIPQAAKLCGVSRTTMWNWVKSGHLEAFVTPGGHHRITEENLKKFHPETQDIPSKARSEKTILIVDDEQEFCNVFQEAMSRLGYRTEIAGDGFEAGMKVLEIRPDLVILDLFMPGIDGFEVCRRIKKNSDLRHTRILAITGFDSPENRDRILEIGADAYLPKSAPFNILMQHIRRLMNGTA